MAFENLGYLNKKKSKKGNDILIGTLKFPKNIKAGEEIKVMVSLTPAKSGGLSVALLTDDEEKGKEDASPKGGASKKGTLF
jgi:hypothetical protein